MIVAKEVQLNLLENQPRHDNAQELHKKVYDVETEQRAQVEDAITINNEIKMKEEFLFAVDFKTEEVIVSFSPKGTSKIKFIERIIKHDNIMIYNAVVTLKSISESSDFDTKIFKMMDKVCQSIYNNYKETKP